MLSVSRHHCGFVALISAGRRRWLSALFAIGAGWSCADDDDGDGEAVAAGSNRTARSIDGFAS